MAINVFATRIRVKRPTPNKYGHTDDTGWLTALVSLVTTQFGTMKLRALLPSIGNFSSGFDLPIGQLSRNPTLRQSKILLTAFYSKE